MTTSPMILAFHGMRAAQRAVLGVDIRATVTGYAADRPAVLNNVESESMVMAGGVAENGGYTILMLRGDLSAIPPKQTAVTCNGPAEGLALEIIDVKNNGPTVDITVADFAAMTT